MSGIRRVVDLGANPWADAPRGHCGATIKLAVRHPDRPRAHIDGQGRPAVFKEKRRDDATWWTATLTAPWWVGDVWIVVIRGAQTERWRAEVLPDAAIFPDGHAAVDRLLARLLAAHVHLPWGRAGVTRAGDLDEAVDAAPPMLHVAALDAWMPRLLTALARIERQPLHALTPARAIRPVEQIGRVDRRTLGALARQPAVAAALRGAPAPGGHRSLDVPVARSSIAHPANRALVHGLRDLDRRLRQAEAAFARWRDGRRGKGAAATKAEAERQIARLVEARAQIARLLRRPLWRRLTPAAPSPSVEQVFADDPTYGDAMRTLRRLRRPAVRPRVAGLVDAHLRPMYDLWEQYVWCRIIRVVRQTLGRGWRWTAPPFVETGLAIGPAPDAFAVAARAGWTVRVGNQVVFPSATRHRAAGGGWSAGRFSLHCTRKPDVTVEVQGPDGALRWLVLDAKFTAARYTVETDHLPVTHHYRDGLRLGGRRPDGVYLVLPALDDTASCYAEPAYHAAFGVGVIVDRGLTGLVGDDAPARDYRPLVEWLTSTLPGD